MPAVSVTGFTVLDVPCHGDPRGWLTPIDFSGLPFQPARVFAVTDVPSGARRGGHGHREQRQLMVCARGRVHVELRVPGAEPETMTLQPGKGLLVEPGVWATQTYGTTDTVLVVLASGPYDPAELFHEPPHA